MQTDATDTEIACPRPASGSEIRHISPTVRATVRNEGKEFARAAIAPACTGGPLASPTTRRPTGPHTTGRLSYGWQRVRVAASDGSINRAMRFWAFG